MTAFSQAYGVEGALGWTVWSQFRETVSIRRASLPLTLARVHCCPQNVADRDIGLQCSRLGTNTTLFHLCQEVHTRYCAAQGEDCNTSGVMHGSMLATRGLGTLPMPASLAAPPAAADTTRTFRERNIGMCHPEAVKDVEHMRSLHVHPEGLTSATTVYNCEPRDSEREGVVYLANFIEPEVLSQLIRDEEHASDSSAYMVSKTSKFGKNTFRVVPKKRFSRTQQYINDRVLRMLGNGTMRNDMLQFTKYPPGVGGLNQLHHDRNFIPDRWVTILAYLQEPKVGGHTVFPTVSPVGVPPSAYAEKIRSLLPPRGQEHNPRMIWKSEVPYDTASSQCAYAAARDRGAPHNNTAADAGFVVAPAAGDAVVFWQWGSDSTGGVLPAWGHYHGACDVEEGTKYSMQAFVQWPGLTRRFHSHATSGARGRGCKYDSTEYALICTPTVGATSSGLVL